MRPSISKHDPTAGQSASATIEKLQKKNSELLQMVAKLEEDVERAIALAASERESVGQKK